MSRPLYCLEYLFESQIKRVQISCVDSELTSYLAIAPLPMNSFFKRPREQFGMDGDSSDPMVLPPVKRSKCRLDHIQSKSFPTVGDITARQYIFSTSRRFLQSGKSCHDSYTSIPTRVEAARASANRIKAVMLNRRKTSQIHPTNLSNGRQVSALLFPLDTALSRMIPSYHPNTQRTKPLPQAWKFEIHEDSEEEEISNLLAQSTHALDISDDESSIAAKNDWGKENIPLMDGIDAVAIMVRGSHQNRVTDQRRTPLGNLGPAMFYADELGE